MWGGNIPSVLAGEFCHAIGITLSLVFLGVLYRIGQRRSSWPFAALLLAIIGLCHTFAFFAAAWYALFCVGFDLPLGGYIAGAIQGTIVRFFERPTCPSSADRARRCSSADRAARRRAPS